MRGFFGIGIENSKFESNLGVLFRSAQAFGAQYIFVIGDRYKLKNQGRGDTCKSWKNLPLFHYKDFQDFKAHAPRSSKLVGVEIVKEGDLRCKPLATSRSLEKFYHPERAIYLLGAEDRGLSHEAIEACSSFVHIPTSICLNVSIAGSIIMYDRVAKLLK